MNILNIVLVRKKSLAMVMDIPLCFQNLHPQNLHSNNLSIIGLMLLGLSMPILCAETTLAQSHISESYSRSSLGFEKVTLLGQQECQSIASPIIQNDQNNDDDYTPPDNGGPGSSQGSGTRYLEPGV